VLEFSHTQFLGDLRGAMGFDWLTSLGAGFELDTSVRTCKAGPSGLRAVSDVLRPFCGPPQWLLESRFTFDYNKHNLSLIRYIFLL
jgi:hypothetical protein